MKPKKPHYDGLTQIGVRIPVELKERLEQQATLNKCTFKAEVVGRLTGSLGDTPSRINLVVPAVSSFATTTEAQEWARQYIHATFAIARIELEAIKVTERAESLHISGCRTQASAVELSTVQSEIRMLFSKEGDVWVCEVLNVRF